MLLFFSKYIKKEIIFSFFNNSPTVNYIIKTINSYVTFWLINFLFFYCELIFYKSGYFLKLFIFNINTLIN